MKKECPSCLGIGKVYNSIKKQSFLCKLCNGKKEVDEIIYKAYNDEFNNN